MAPVEHPETPDPPPPRKEPLNRSEIVDQQIEKPRISTTTMLQCPIRIHEFDGDGREAFIRGESLRNELRIAADAGDVGIDEHDRFGELPGEQPG